LQQLHLKGASIETIWLCSICADEKLHHFMPYHHHYSTPHMVSCGIDHSYRKYVCKMVAIKLHSSPYCCVDKQKHIYFRKLSTSSFIPSPDMLNQNSMPKYTIIMNHDSGS